VFDMKTLAVKKGMKIVGSGEVKAFAEAALDQGRGLLRLAPCWVPRKFLQPGLRLKLAPADTYAFGLDRGGIDERWFGSTTEAGNENRTDDEGLSYVTHGAHMATLKDVVDILGADVVGNDLWSKYRRWPVYSKFFDNMGPIPHHMHHNAEQAQLVGQEGKPEGYFFPAQHNAVGNNFPFTFFGLTPGTSKADVRRCLENWNRGDNGILDISQAYRLQTGTGWLVPPGVLHAPGSLCTYEPQWGSDVFGMYQSLVEGRAVEWELLTQNVPEEKHNDLDYLVGQLDWERNVDPHFKEHSFLEPIVCAHDDGAWFDRWIVYGRIDGRQWFSAKELTVLPGASCKLQDTGAYSLITVQGRGMMNHLLIDSPKMIGFHDMTEDEVFCSEAAAREGVTFENTSDTEPLVMLRYFGPERFADAPDVGDHRKRQ
jgi:hypothetical protein